MSRSWRRGVTAARPSAVVIGAGVSGLASAITLADAGYAVTVLEAHSIPGGMIQRYRRGGDWFDTGFHFLTASQPGGIFRRVCRFLGIVDELHFLPPDIHGQWRFHYPQVTVDLPANWQHIGERFEQYQADSRPGVERFFGILRSCMAANPLLRHEAPEATPQTIDGHISVAQTLTRCGVSGLAATVLGQACAILGMSAEECPMALYSAFAGTGIAGSWRLRDGGDGLIQPLIARLTALGGELRCRHRAQHIMQHQHRVQGVRDHRGIIHPAEIVIASCHPQIFSDHLAPHLMRPSSQQRLATIPDSVSAIAIACRLRASANLGPRHHFFRLDDGGEAYAIAPDGFDPSLPPLLESLVYVPTASCAQWADLPPHRRNSDYQLWKEQQADRLVNALERTFPGLSTLIDQRWVSSPLTIRDYTGSRGGAAFGLSHSVDHLGRLPLAAKTRLTGGYLTGHSIHHPGILGSLCGGCVSALSAIGRDFSAELAEIR